MPDCRPLAPPPAEPTTRPPTDTARLLDFLSDHDAPCPVCGYNLRDLTKPVCPECRHALELTVGVDGLRIGLFVATLAPFLSAGLAAIALGTLLTMAELTKGAGAGGPPPIFHLITLLGLGSGAVAALIFWKRRRFLALPPGAQRRWAMLAWTLHVLPFLGLVILFLATS